MVRQATKALVVKRAKQRRCGAVKYVKFAGLRGGVGKRLRRKRSGRGGRGGRGGLGGKRSFKLVANDGVPGSIIAEETLRGCRRPTGTVSERYWMARERTLNQRQGVKAAGDMFF